MITMLNGVVAFTPEKAPLKVTFNSLVANSYHNLLGLITVKKSKIENSRILNFMKSPKLNIRENLSAQKLPDLQDMYVSYTILNNSFTL